MCFGREKSLFVCLLLLLLLSLLLLLMMMMMVNEHQKSIEPFSRHALRLRKERHEDMIITLLNVGFLLFVFDYGL